MKINIILTSLFFILLFGSSCNTDVNVNADYEVFPIIYCVLDPSAEYQYVKVNKSFLGDKPAAEMAIISDSLFFSGAEVILKEYKNGTQKREWRFDAVEIPKDTGYFASDKNLVYRKNINFGDYDRDTEYELVVNIENGRFIVTGNTKLVYGSAVTKPASNTRNIDFAKYEGAFTYRFRAGYSANIYQMVITFNYFEVEGNDTVYKSIKFPQTTDMLPISYNNDVVDKDFQISSFYDVLVNTIQPTDRDVKRYVKMPNSVTFNLVVADENYYTYSQVSAPSTGIAQHKPSFTNLSEGYGLFASRYNEYMNVKLGKSTLDSLNKGSHTSNLKFVPWSDQYYYQYLD
ncbi:MAG: hypothetical protein LBQ22_03610 [Bacteroidales bacterium]|jgi:hypothetical protein|nr:hypothetical protein [Bacteroidales bacterium]